MFTNSLRFFKVYLQSVKTKYKSIKIKRLFQQSSLPQNLARPTPEGTMWVEKNYGNKGSSPLPHWVTENGQNGKFLCQKYAAKKVPKLWKEVPHLRNTVLFFQMMWSLICYIRTVRHYLQVKKHVRFESCIGPYLFMRKGVKILKLMLTLIITRRGGSSRKLKDYESVL